MLVYEWREAFPLRFRPSTLHKASNICNNYILYTTTTTTCTAILKWEMGFLTLLALALLASSYKLTFLWRCLAVFPFNFASCLAASSSLCSFSTCFWRLSTLAASSLTLIWTRLELRSILCSFDEGEVSVEVGGCSHEVGTVWFLLLSFKQTSIELLLSELWTCCSSSSNSSLCLSGDVSSSWLLSRAALPNWGSMSRMADANSVHIIRYRLHSTQQTGE